MQKQSSKNVLKKQALAFAITGTLSTALMLLLYWGLINLIGYQLAYFISFSASVLLLYFLNTFFVFKTPLSWSGFLKFPFIYALQYVVGAFSLGFMVRMGVPKELAPILVVILVLPITFVLNRLVLTKKPMSSKK